MITILRALGGRNRPYVMKFICSMLMVASFVRATDNSALLRGGSNEENAQVIDVLKSNNDFFMRSKAASDSTPTVLVESDTTQKLLEKENDLGNLSHDSIDSVIHVPVETDTIGLSTGEEEESSHFSYIPQAKMASDEHTGLYENYIDVRKGEILSTQEEENESYLINSAVTVSDESSIVLSDATSSLCGDFKTHAAVATAIIAGIATIFAGPTAPAYWTYLAAASTGANGLTNYITCGEESTSFLIDTEQIEKIAQQVYEANSIELSISRVKQAFGEFKDSLTFQQSIETLKRDIDRLYVLLPELTESYNARVVTADLLIMIGSYLSSAYPMRLAKIGSGNRRGDPGTSSRSSLGGSCGESFNDFLSSIKTIKEHLDEINWESQKTDFLSEASCSTYRSGSKYICSNSPGGGEKYCYKIGSVCSATYGGNEFSLEGVTDGYDCEYPCTYKNEKPTQVTKEMLAQQKFKPKFDEWYQKLGSGWEALNKLYSDLQQAKSSDEHYAEKNLCAKFEKPLCLPRFFYNNELKRCCDGTPLGGNNIRPYQCGNLEGTCEPTLSGGTFDECKPGFECVRLDTILSQRPSDSDLILERTGWGTWESTSNRYVCYSANAPLPGPFDEPAITLYPTPKPTSAPTKKPVAPPPPPPSPGPCFSSTSMVNHMNHGLVPISDINIGDYIQSHTDGSFSRVYAFKKNNHEDTEFYQLHSRTGTLVEVTDRHLVFLKNKSLPIAARDVRIGDVLKSVNPEDDTEVVKIEVIHREGYYNPFTESGTFVLNDGVVASSYDVSSSSSSDFFDGPTEMLHWHTLAHFACAPLRFVCKSMSFDVCSDSDNQNEDGLHKFIVFLTTLRKLKDWQQVAVLPVIFGAGVLFTLLEFFYDLGEAFYETISSTSAEAAAAQHDGSFGLLFAFSLTVAALVPSAIFLWRKKYHLS